MKIQFTNQKIRRSLFNLTISLMVLVTILIAQIPSTIAAPAPIFRPILKEIRNKLPYGVVMRLPSYLPNSQELYATVGSEGLYRQAPEKGFVVMISTIQNCSYHACDVGGFTVYPGTNKSLRSLLSEGLQDITNVKLGKGIQGLYSFFNGGSSQDRAIIWKQNGLLFKVDCRAGWMSKQQLINLAKSMAKEPPIRGY